MRALPRRPWLLWLGLLAGCAIALLRSPSLDAGLLDDDYIQAAQLDHAFPIERGPLDLYWFSGRDAAEARALMEQGYEPWWTHPEHRIAMLRPFASGLIAVEHALELSSVARHALSLAMFALCVWLGFRVLLEVLPQRVAIVAGALYALDESFIAPTAWLANRSTLISTALAWLALTSYVRARDAGSSAGPRQLALLLLAFVSGEYGFFVVAYLAAFELVRLFDRAEAPTALLRALAPVLALGAWVAGGGALLGYGVAYSGFYISPLHDPLRFALAAIARVPGLYCDLALGIPARSVDDGFPVLRELALARGFTDPAGWLALPSYRAVAWLLMIPIALGAWRLTRALSRRAHALGSLRWLVLGAAFAVAPSVGALPSSRLLCGTALGVAALIASALVHAFDRLRAHGSPGARLGALAALIALGFVHGVAPAMRAHADAQAFAIRAQLATRWALRAEIPKQLTPRTQVWVVGSSDFTTAAQLPWVRRFHGLPRIDHYRLLSGAALPHDLLRLDDRTLEVAVLSTPVGAFLGSLYRPEDAPFHAGDRIELQGVSIEIRFVTPAGVPRRFRVRADRSLDDPSIVLLCPQPSGLKRCEMPKPGFALRVPRAPVPWGDPTPSRPPQLRRMDPAARP